MKWFKKAPSDGRMIIPTMSSRPHNHPKALDKEIVKAIVKQRLKYNRCSEVVHQELINQGKEFLL